MTIVAINAMILEKGQLSGIGNYIVQLLEGFARLDRAAPASHQIIVICRADAARHFDRIAGLDVRRVSSGRGRFARVLVEQLRLPWMLRSAKVDVLLNPAFTGPVWGARAIVTTVHDVYFRIVPDLVPVAQRRFLGALVPICCRRSRIVITPSQSTRRDLEQSYPDLAGKIRVIPLASRFPASPIQDEVVAQEKFVLIVAALTGNKNAEPLVAAIARLRDRHPTLSLVHIGRDPDGQLEKAVAKHEAAAWTCSRQDVSDAELSAAYRQCLCVVVPSLYEGFGLPLLEAQAFGAPLISSDRGSLPEVGGAGAIYIDPADVGAIATAIDLLVQRPDRRETLRRAGYANLARFSWEKTARTTWNALLGAGA